MEDDWMIHVLRDLRTFAELNGMDALARKLEETGELARLSIVAGGASHRPGRAVNAQKPRSPDREAVRDH